MSDRDGKCRVNGVNETDSNDRENLFNKQAVESNEQFCAFTVHTVNIEIINEL